MSKKISESKIQQALDFAYNKAVNAISRKTIGDTAKNIFEGII
jgi:hypothetical protein